MITRREAVLTLLCAKVLASQTSAAPRTQFTLRGEIDERIHDFLATPFTGFSTDVIQHPSLGIFALSNMAEGLVEYATAYPRRMDRTEPYLDRVVEAALHPSVRPNTLSFKGDLGFHGVYLSHLNIILGERERVTTDGKHQGINRRVSEHLMRGSLEDPHSHFRSYPNQPYKWPADQAALLYSLCLYDTNFGTNLAREPARRWLKYMKESATDSGTKLHHSEVTGISYGTIPRGSGLSWTVKYLARIAPNETGKLWKHYKEGFLQDYGIVAGFREWPIGADRGADSDSGPIVQGIGAAATGIGVGAAKFVGDRKTYFKLRNLVSGGTLVASLSGFEALQRASNDLLARSLLFSGKMY